MKTKYDVKYALQRRGGLDLVKDFETDDPVACETFLMEALEKGYKIQEIHRNGTPLVGHSFDNMIKTAAGMMTKEHVCKSLDVDSVDAHYRFGCLA